MNVKNISIGVLACCAVAAIGVAIYYGTKDNSATPDDTIPDDNVDTSKCGYNSCHALDPTKLNIHVVPHTHDDAGWLKTVDIYFEDQVKYILNSIAMEVGRKPERRFIYVEVSFLSRWWRRADDDLKENMKQLVQNGQLQFTLGHWTMPDEAITHYEDLIVNAELGMRFLEDNFGECGRPLVGWQIDPFGHSKGVRDLYERMGYDALFLGRVDDTVFDERRQANEMEFMWGDLFTVINPNLYTTPYTYCWDSGCDSWENGEKWDYHRPDTFIQDDPELENYNVEERITTMYDWIMEKYDPGYTTNNFLLTMGGDFHFKNANQYYDNLDKMIKYTNEMYGDKVNMIYSTPACYAKAVSDAKAAQTESWSTYEDDFFPYCSGYDDEVRDTSYWSGYYASRSELKQDIRKNSTMLNVCNQLEATGLAREKSSDKLRKVIALTQHHDAVTGTEKEHVVWDYSKRMVTATESCKVGIDNDETSDQVAVYNPLAWDRTSLVDVDGQLLKVELPALGWVNLDGSEEVIPPVEAAFSDNVVVLTDKFMIAEFSPNGTIRLQDTSGMLTGYTITQDFYYFDSEPGSSNYDTGLIQPSGAYIFRPLGGDQGPHPCSQTLNLTKVSEIEVRVDSTEFTEQQYIQRSWRLEEDGLVMYYEICELPVDNEKLMGREVVARFDLLDKDTADSTWYTDTNSWGFIERSRENSRPADPIASRYFPVTSQSYLELASGDSFLVTGSRAAGVTSLETNRIDMMLHRRTLVDDWKGVNQAMNDTTSVQGRIVVDFGVLSRHYMHKREKEVQQAPVVIAGGLRPEVPTSHYRAAAAELQNPAFLNYECDAKGSCSALKTNLPDGIALLTAAWDSYLDNVAIMRFHNIRDYDLTIENLAEFFSIRKEVSKVWITNIAATLYQAVEISMNDQITVPSNDIMTLRFQFL